MGARRSDVGWGGVHREQPDQSRVEDASRTKGGGDAQPAQAAAASSHLLRTASAPVRIRPYRGDPPAQAARQHRRSTTRARSAMPAARRACMREFLIALIVIYRNTLSNLMLQTCKFTPSCSEYAIQAIRIRGALAGLWLTSLRLFRCHPLARGGWDPVR
jgi:putative membrane protein insertion efficiency factor